MSEQCDILKGVAHSAEPTEDYHPNLQLSFMLSFNSVFSWFTLTVLMA